MNYDSTPRIGLAANRRLGFQVLQLLVQNDMTPHALLVPQGRSVDMWTAKTVDLFRQVAANGLMIHGKSFREPNGVEQLGRAQLDYVISIHFPYIVPAHVLNLPRVGTLNLHPAYLPYNRGWHTPSWAIADGTPYGATLHWMDEGVDTGDIALQKQVAVTPSDTANELYQRVLVAEFELLREALPLLVANRLPRIPQVASGTEHCKADLQSYQGLDLSARESVGGILRKLRALTTNSWDEAAYFDENGVRYHVQVAIQPATAPALQRKAA